MPDAMTAGAPLPDFGAPDVGELAARTAHPVLAAVLDALRSRPRHTGGVRGAAAYYDEVPDGE